MKLIVLSPTWTWLLRKTTCSGATLKCPDANSLRRSRSAMAAACAALPLMSAPEDAAVAEALGTLLVSEDRKSTRLNSSHSQISYAVFCLKKKKTYTTYSLVPFLPPSGECRSSTTHNPVRLSQPLHHQDALDICIRLHYHDSPSVYPIELQ